MQIAYLAAISPLLLISSLSKMDFTEIKQDNPELGTMLENISFVAYALEQQFDELLQELEKQGIKTDKNNLILSCLQSLKFSYQDRENKILKQLGHPTDIPF